MAICCVSGCTNNSRSCHRREINISFHKFPKSRVEEWKSAIGQPFLNVTPATSICSIHFAESDFLANYLQRKHLKPDAIPSLNLPAVIHFKQEPDAIPSLNLPDAIYIKQELIFADPLYIPCTTPHQDASLPLPLPPTSSNTSDSDNGYRTIKTEIGIQEETIGSDLSESSDQSVNEDLVQLIERIHSYSQSPLTYESALAFKKKQVSKLRNKLVASRQRIQRLRKNVYNLTALVRRLKSALKISSNALRARKMEDEISGIPSILMKRLLTNTKGKKNNRPYPEELKQFAMRLQFYSPKAYKFVRQSFKSCLPAPSMIRSWLSEVNNCELECSEPVLQNLNQLVNGRDTPVIYMMFNENLEEQTNHEENTL